MLVGRLGELGVWPEAYRINGRVDGAWCLNHTPRGWEVARYAAGAPVEPRRFGRLEDAAQHLRPGASPELERMPEQRVPGRTPSHVAGGE